MISISILLQPLPLLLSVDGKVRLIPPVSAATGAGLDKLRQWLDKKIGQKDEK